MPETERKSTAIIFTDMVGYRDTLRQDESLARHLLDRQRSVIRQCSNGYGGRYFGEDLAPDKGIGLKGWLTGAGAKTHETRLQSEECIILFENAVDSTRCAVEIQRLLREYNREAPSKKDIYVRIGIHIGDVTERTDELSGEAVAIASKIATLAEPGGICLSEQVCNQVRNTVDLSYFSLGTHELKNVPRPIEVYGVKLHWDREGVVEEATDGKRVAVLPFANFSPDQHDEYFADGMTEEVISTISNISEFSVISRTSVMGYKGTTKKVGEIARELRVGSVLEGSVRKAGNRIRVTVQLINVKSDKHLWAQSYDRDLDDVFAVQSDIAKQVADTLRVRMLPNERRQIEKKPTKSMEAYTLYLKGRYDWNERSKEALLKAMDYFKRAVEVDPDYALAYSGIADCYYLLGDWGYIPYEEAFLKAKENALKAVQLDDSSAEAHTSLGGVLASSYDWEGMEREFQRGIELNPNYATAHHWYGFLLMRAGRFEDSLRELSVAQQLDPLSLIINVNCGDIYLLMKKYSLAEEQIRKALDLDPDFPWGHATLSWVYVQEGKYDEAEREVNEYLRLTNYDPRARGYLAVVYAYAGKESEARTILDEVSSEPSDSHFRKQPLVVAYLRLGDKEKAIELIQRAFEDRADWLTDLAWWPAYSSVRSDPRVVGILKKIGLAS